VFNKLVSLRKLQVWEDWVWAKSKLCQSSSSFELLNKFLETRREHGDKSSSAWFELNFWWECGKHSECLLWLKARLTIPLEYNEVWEEIEGVTLEVAVGWLGDETDWFELGWDIDNRRESEEEEEEGDEELLTSVVVMVEEEDDDDDEVVEDEDEDDDDDEDEADEEDNDEEVIVEKSKAGLCLKLELNMLLSLAQDEWLVGVGGAIFDKTELKFLFDVIKSLAEEFISTKEIGKIPILPSSLPSAQLSSIFRIRVITSFLTKKRQSFSSTSVTLKSYNALHCGVVTTKDRLGKIWS